jgi:hypothetical protein
MHPWRKKARDVKVSMSWLGNATNLHALANEQGAANQRMLLPHCEDVVKLHPAVIQIFQSVLLTTVETITALRCWGDW